MTDASRPPDPMRMVDVLPPVHGVALRGPGPKPGSGAGRGGEWPPSTAPVDGVAVIFFDPNTGSPYLVFVSEGLAAVLGRGVDELLGRSPFELFGDEGQDRFGEVRRALGIDRQRRNERRAVAGMRPLVPGQVTGTDARPGRDLLGTPDVDVDIDVDIDLDADHPDRAPEQDQGDDDEAAPSRRHTATQRLVRSDGREVLVHATYTSVPSMTPAAPYVVAQFRDLEQPSAERLLADQAAVVGSLSRGDELGRLCHQMASQVEEELADGSRCWVAVAAGPDRLEPVLGGDLPFEVVSGIMGELLGIGSPGSRRLVPVGALSDELAQPLRARSVTSLWYLPLVGDESEPIRGAIVVATPRERPDRASAQVLEHLAAVMSVAVEQATVDAELAHQTLHDPLTRLPNRALLVDRLGQALARLERDGIALSALLVDIDRFKTVNDTRGAEVGDQVLLEVAARLLAVVRLGDTVGRISSDQYLVMCVAGRGELDAAAVGRRILRSLAEPITVADGDDLHLTASIGVVVVDEPGPTPADVISNAESALARASARGRGRMAMYEDDLRQHVVERHRTEQALHRAITNGELVIHYQPLVEIRTGFMIGAEALVRWDRPGHGLLGPPAFIPIAEESELIIPMGNWIIDRVCGDLGRWPKSRGRAPMVTINLAARQLAVDTLVPTIVSALRRNDLLPNRVGFEITESMEIGDAEAAQANLERLSELGCRIAIDDFGIGHATLEYIRRFSMADALKLDKSFVAGLGTSPEDTAIVHASLALAESLGLQVIAEGVEQPEQLTALRELGCRYAQGFGLARPLPLDQVLELWQQGRLYEPAWD